MNGLTVTGLKETQRALKAMEATVGKKIIRKGLRAGAKITKAAAQSEAPDRTGLLRSKIKVMSGGSRKGRISIAVGVRAKDFAQNAFYADFVLYGHRVGSSKLGDARAVVPPNDFLGRAAASSAQGAIDATTEKWADEIEKAAANKGNG